MYVRKIKKYNHIHHLTDTQKFSKLNEGQTCDHSFYTCQVPKYSFHLDLKIQLLGTLSGLFHMEFHSTQHNATGRTLTMRC